ncbi:hypothetical protein [Deinococcus sp.]|uniref:hypothetical protein n=1 Tax=Deinococcus sp. TaxID=47478 RepID=UPI00286E6938|nr:hypothetical protein [Deinococcus sp.]
MVLHVLGHVHLTRREETVPVSRKAAALLTYLCLEGLAHHREHLAELLWNTPDPLRNLRVELARLKRDDVAHFPERQPMLAFRAPLDLSAWLSAAQDVQGEQLLPWLSKLRGLPLSGLEDLGSSRYQQWLEGQRWAIIEQVECTLGRVWWRLARAGQQTQAEQIRARAEQLGLRLPNADPDEAELNAAETHRTGMHSAGIYGTGLVGAEMHRTEMHRTEVIGAGTFSAGRHSPGPNGVRPEITDLNSPELNGAGPGSAGNTSAEPHRIAPDLTAPDTAAPDTAASDRTAVPNHRTDALPWECVWEEQRLLTQLLERSTSPHLLLLYGRGGSGKRNLLRQSVEGSGWQLIQLQASVQQSLFQEALAQQLSRVLPARPGIGQSGSGQPGADQSGSGQLGAGGQGAARQWPDPPPLYRPGSADDGLIDLASGLRRSGLRLVIAVHNALLGQSWLPGLVRFLLDLPLPLILVLSETLPARLDAVGEQVAFVDAQRVTRLQMSPLTARMVLRAWEQRPGEGLPGQPAGPGDQTLTRAARLIQRSEGWPLHVQALYRQGPHQSAEPPAAQLPAAQLPATQSPSIQSPSLRSWREPFWPSFQTSLPEAVQTALLGEVTALPAEVRHQLARLSLIHTGFDRELAELLGGQDGSRTLLYAAQQGLLVPAAGHEHVQLPSLHYRSDDQTRWLQFCSEALRVALAGSLTGLERHEVRQSLARFFLGSRPALSLHYARKAGLADVEAQATQALTAQDSAAEQRTARPPSGLKPPSSGAVRATAPAALAAFRRETRTPNGYRVALDSGHLEVMRHGCYGPPPLLTLGIGEVAAGSWSLTARTDVFRAAPELGARPAAYALGLRAGDGPRTVYTVQQADLEVGGEAGEDPAEIYGGCLPAGEWFTLRGVGGGGTLELSVRALDVALTVAELNWGSVRVLPMHG